MGARFATISLLAAALFSGCASNDASQDPVAQESVDEQAALTAGETLAASLNEDSLRGLTPGVARAFTNERVDVVFIPLASLPESFDVGSVAPAEIVSLARSNSLVEDRWLLTRRLERVTPGDPRASFTALVVPRNSLGDRAALRFGDLAVALVPASLPERSARTVADSFTLLRPALLDPSIRWRARLALDRFGVRGIGEPFPDQAIEAYASALELRARAALDNLRAADAALADRLHAALGRTLTFPGGVIAPAWTESDARLDDVFKVLLDESVDRALAADRVRQWIEAQQRAVAWIADDADVLGTRIHVAELAGVADIVAARAAPTESCDPATLHPILARTVAEIDLKCRVRPSRRAIRVQVGDWTTSLDALAAPMDVAPPGLRIGPLMLPHSMRSLLASQVVLPDAAHATAALLRRKASSDEWQIYAECLAPESERASNAGETVDTLRLYFGVRESPRAIMEIRADSSATLRSFTPDGQSDTRAIGATVREEPDRWIVFADVPSDAFEPDGTLVIGVERVDARGVRSVWPRPTLPWDDTPSRVAMDPSTWPRLGAR